MQKFLLTAALFCAYTTYADTLSLKDALQNPKLKCEFKGNANSTHYLYPLQAELQNNENRVRTVIIENGQQFNSSIATMQNLVIVKSEAITLAPFQKKTFLLSAMCTERNDAAPGDHLAYMPAGTASGSLLQLTRLIEHNGFYDIAAQQAIWCVTDSAALHDIDGYDTAAVRTLQNMVSRITGRPVPPAPAVRNYGRPVITDSLSGSFTYTVRVNSSVLIAMFDKDNRVVRELYRNNNESPGKKNFEFAFDSTVYEDEVYYIRLLINGTRQLQGTVRRTE